MNFYMKDFLRVEFYPKDTFGYMAERREQIVIQKYIYIRLRDMRAHKFHVISFNLDGRELFEFNLFDVWIKKYIRNK